MYKYNIVHFYASNMELKYMDNLPTMDDLDTEPTVE